MESTAGSVRTAFIADDSQYTPTMRKMQAQAKAFGVASTEAGNQAAKAGMHMVAPWQASSAALRVMEGNMTNNIRAAERFLAMIPGVGKALQAAFPVVGAIALAGVVGKLIGEVVKFIEKANAAPTAIRAAWRSLDVSADSANDKLAVTNDKLEEQIAKLEGKHANNLKTELDEAKVSADELAESLSSAARRMSELMKDNHISGLSGFISGQAVTSTAEGSIKSFNNKISELGFQKQEALQGGDTSGAAKIDKQIHDAQQSALDWSSKQLKIGAFRQKLNKYTLGATGNYSAAMSDVTGFQHQIRAEMYGEQLHKQHDADEQRLDKDKQDKAKKEPKVKPEKLADLHLGGSHMDEYRARFYRKQQDGRDAVARTHGFKDEKDQTETQSQFQSMQRIGSRMFGVDSIPKGDAEKERRDNYESQRQAIIDAHKKSAETISQGQQTGTINAHQAVVENAANDAKAYNQQVTLLKANLREINIVTDDQLTIQKKVKENASNYLETEKLTAEYQQQQAKTALEFQQTTVRGGAAQGTADYLRQFDPASSASTIATGTLADFNSSMVSGMTTGKLHAAGMFRNISGTLGTQALGGAENHFLSGPLGKMLGAQTKLGSKSNPMYTISVSGQTQSVSPQTFLSSIRSSKTGSGVMNTVTSSISDLIPDGKTGSGGILKTIGGLFGKVAPMAIPFLAGGGDLGANMPAIVGENGPELFQPKSAGTVIPNQQASSAMGGGGTVNHIDARGAVDPAATAAAVHDAITKSAHASVRNAVHASHETRMRSPLGAR